MAIEYGESDLRVRYEKYRRILDNLTIMDDIFMRNVLNQPACTEYLLQIIMQNEELKLLDCMVQKDFKNLQGRSVYMDCVAQDTEKCRYDVEIQQDNGGASFKRAGYHCSLMDMHSLEPGQNFDVLPEHFVIFITRPSVDFGRSCSGKIADSAWADGPGKRRRRWKEKCRMRRWNCFRQQRQRTVFSSVRGYFR